MKALKLLLCIILGSLPLATMAQDKPIELSGQLSTYLNLNPTDEFQLNLGSYFIPELTWGKSLGSNLLDVKLSANIKGAYTQISEHSSVEGDIDPYRIWARYYGNQFELRAGLQKINFGSSTNLRPLRWFDQVDPRDPLAITSGVWGLLGRYYFLNNANIWIWGLYGNENPKGWEFTKTVPKQPEFGGRIQLPVTRGEIALSYHHRVMELNSGDFFTDESAEHRFGLDGKWDLTLGFWIEATHTIPTKNVGQLANQTLINIGTDYTFDIGNGPTVILEHMTLSYDKEAFQFQDPQFLTALSGSYPLNFFDNLSAVFFYDWKREDLFSYLNYQRDLKNFTLFTMLYLNPSGQIEVQQNSANNQFAGRGIQFILVYNF